VPAVPAPVVHREPSPSARCRHRCRHCHHHGPRGITLVATAEHCEKRARFLSFEWPRYFRVFSGRPGSMYMRLPSSSCPNPWRFVRCRFEQFKLTLTVMRSDLMRIFFSLLLCNQYHDKCGLLNRIHSMCVFDWQSCENGFGNRAGCAYWKKLDKVKLADRHMRGFVW
jgi:hypothetical protein